MAGGGGDEIRRGKKKKKSDVAFHIRVWGVVCECSNPLILLDLK